MTNHLTCFQCRIPFTDTDDHAEVAMTRMVGGEAFPHTYRYCIPCHDRIMAGAPLFDTEHERPRDCLGDADDPVYRDLMAPRS